MGLIDHLDQLDLSDEVKDQIRREHEQEISQRDAENRSLRRETKKADVEKEIADLKGLGLSDPGLLKYVRRVFLSDDEEAGGVLLSDEQMNLSGDDTTGATREEEVTVAGALRNFISLLPKEDGKIKLSDQALLSDGDVPDGLNNDDDSDESKAAEHKERLSKLTGHTAPRTRKRYGAVTVGGDN